MMEKDTRSLDSIALGVAQRVDDTLNSQRGILENKRSARMMKVVMALLEFKSPKDSEEWLLKQNPGFGNLPPVDLVNSEYATLELLKVVQELKEKACARKYFKH